VSKHSTSDSSYVWNHFTVLHLIISTRYSGDPAYPTWVDRVGERVVLFETIIHLGHLDHVNNMGDAAKPLYLDDSTVTSLDAAKRSFLSPLNSRVDEFNQLMLEKVPGVSSTYLSQDTIKELNNSSYYLPNGSEADLLADPREPGIPPHDLSLKVGCIATIMRNISLEKGLVKNTRVQVVSLLPNLVQVRLLQQNHLAHTSAAIEENLPYLESCVNSNLNMPTGLSSVGNSLYDYPMELPSTAARD